MNNIIKLIVAILLINCNALAQHKVIVLINKISHDSIFLKENLRIKLHTKEDSIIAGKFKIIDENSILIKKDTILLSNIKKIKKVSGFSAFIRPIAVIIGLVFTSAGIYGIYLGSTGDALGGGILGSFLLPGLPMLVCPFLDNEHKFEKWDYKIIEKSNTR
jgi:hypothetical protein